MLPRHVVVVVYDDVQALDVVGPVEVFAGVATGARAAAYRITVASADGAPVRTSSGLRLAVDAAIDDVTDRVDTLVVAGGQGTAAAMVDRRVCEGVLGLARRARRVTSVCSGAFLLAEVGLLAGRRATTHWSVCGLLARRYPDVTVEAEPIFVRDGNVWTSAGVTAGMDLALALVEDDLGRDAALAIARRLVLFLRRPGNQAQFSAHLAAGAPARLGLRDVQRWIAEHPSADLTVDALASHAGMSPRHFARTFTAELGTTPGRYVEQARVEAARRRLEESDDSIEAVAAGCGFGTAETLRRAFLRTVRVAPSEYRRRFRAA